MAASAAIARSGVMRVLKVVGARKTFPTGDPSFAVQQPFPASLTTVETDPFLMCDYFGPTSSNGVETDPDAFPVDWHPHKGFDIATYMIEGRGRHADSMGNRESFESPGMQWVSVGSGIEHAEAGGTPAGQRTTGFQLWVNVPSARKNDDPRYGTVPPSALPIVELPGGVRGRVLAGPVHGVVGPFLTVQPLQMVDYVLPPNAALEHAVPTGMETALAYVYAGGVRASSPARDVPFNHAVLFDATTDARTVVMTAGAEGASVMLFSGQRLDQPVAWHGPFVMTTQAEITATIAQYRSGDFPPVRVPWDYRRIDDFPADVRARLGAEWQPAGTDAAAGARNASLGGVVLASGPRGAGGK